MNSFLPLFLPLLLVCLPMVFQGIFTYRRLKHQTKLPLIGSMTIALLAGIIMPVVAFNLSVSILTADWPKGEPRCLTGFVGILVLGYLLAMAGPPVLGLIGRLLYTPLPPASSRSKQ